MSGDAGIGGNSLHSLNGAHAVHGERALARRSLGQFLRLMRDRAQPTDRVRAQRRRARGLRREEVAVDAGISLTWYTWLEQGRPLRVSDETLQRIARALRLEATERAHLFRLAGAGTAPADARGVTESATTTLRQLVDALAPHAAYAVNGRWDVLCWNAPAHTLFGDFGARPGVTDNILRRLFLDADWRVRFHEWDAICASAVAQFRAATAHMVADDEWVAFVEELAGESAAFRACWTRHELANPLAREKILLHPEAGRLTLRYAPMAPEGEAADVRAIVYTAADGRTATALGALDDGRRGVARD